MKEFDRFSFPRNYSGKVPLFFRKFPEKFRRKFPEISELTTLPVRILHYYCMNKITIISCLDGCSCSDECPYYYYCYSPDGSTGVINTRVGLVTAKKWNTTKQNLYQTKHFHYFHYFRKHRMVKTF